MLPARLQILSWVSQLKLRCSSKYSSLISSQSRLSTSVVLPLSPLRVTMLLIGLGRPVGQKLTHRSGKPNQDQLSLNQLPSQIQFSCINANTTLGEGGRETGNVHSIGWICFFLSPFSVNTCCIYVSLILQLFLSVFTEHFHAVQINIYPVSWSVYVWRMCVGV